MMKKVEKLLLAIEKHPTNVAYADLCKICDHYFGKPRQKGTSHRIYKTPWPGDPRVNIQKRGNKAKPYQVKQVLRAIQKLGRIEKNGK